MTYYKFKEDDLFINTIEANPKYSFYIQSGSLYLDNVSHISGANTNNIHNVPVGHLSLYEYNIDRKDNFIKPFVIKNSNRSSFKKTKKTAFNTQFGFDGAQINSTYRMSASLSRDYFAASSTRRRITALKNNFDYYSYLSPHYEFTSTFGDKATQQINLISIPSIFYGSSIEKGSLSLKYYITGSLVGELSDYRKNGELVQIGPVGSTGSGSVAGVVLYSEGFIALTGSWSLDSHNIAYDSTSNSKWVHFGYGIKNSAATLPTIANTTLSASFLMEYEGVTHTQVLTMLSHAPYAELNHSNNPTFATASTAYQYVSGAHRFTERPKQIKNMVNSQFVDVEPEFKKVVYISKIGIYDDNKNLIGIAKLATPVRKTEDHEYTFKLKLDI
tara:strand:- start:544 stop:1704 length:1161 start_codon:yes stop_codon:yes gene_type:complete